MFFYSIGLAAGLFFGAPWFDGQSSEAPLVEVKYDRNRDFTQYDSYAWSKSQKPTAKPADHIRITKAVSRKLEELGVEPDKANPDLRIAYRLETGKKKMHVDSRQKESIWDPTDLETTISLGGHEETNLVLEMFDTATGELVWWAKCNHVQPTADRVEKSLYDTVERLFEVYPSGDDAKKRNRRSSWPASCGNTKRRLGGERAPLLTSTNVPLSHPSQRGARGR